MLDQIHDIPIADIIGKYASLKQAGVNYKACCPLHDEKTPSFVVFPRTNTFKCFGCGAGGDAITFVMLHKHLQFIDACKEIAADHSLQIDFANQPAPDPGAEQRRESILGIMHQAQQFFVSQLNSEKGTEALAYISGRFSPEIIQKWGIGFAPDAWHDLHNHLIEKGYNNNDLIAIGLLSQSGDRIFDTFRNRVMFPLTDIHGRPVAFSGRSLGNKTDKKNPKYINTTQTEIFTKGSLFYGINTAITEIRKTKKAYLVEGNPDVIRLQEVGPVNTIAPLGTSLTKDQVEFLSKNCTSVTIIGDGDSAGANAVNSHAQKLIQAGLFVNVITLPVAEDTKEDPDSFFAVNDFYQYEEKFTSDFIVWTCFNNANAAKRPDVKQAIISQVSGLIARFPSSTQELYIEQVSAIIKPKKAWTDEIKAINKLNAPPEEKTHDHEIIPEHVDANDFEKYGFFEDNNQYFFRTNKGVIRGSNFTMKPLFHVQSVIDSKRLFVITNEFRYTQVIELAQKDLISLQAFRLRVESLGNFLWEASEIELNKLKRYIYENTETCTEIKQLGWQKHGFWAWGNGIFNGSYSPVNEYGIVSHKEINYYIPAFSKIYEREDSLYVSERKFVHQPTAVTMHEIVRKLEDVFGTNAQITYCFFLATCFRDIIAGRFGFFPILNLFGPKGAGKTEMAISMLHFFGKLGKGPNINNTSKAALADHIAQHANALCHIDEYKNNVEFEKIEFLKGIWDGTGRTRMNMDKDKKKETTSVDIGLMLTGQEMPTADIALFSRLIFLTFTQTEYTDDEKLRFNQLKDILNAGVTHLTHEVIAHRKYFLENFFENYDTVCTDINKLLGDNIIEDRIFRNWTIVIAAFYTLKDKVITHIEYPQLLQLAVSLIVRQNSETKRTNDVANFWEIFNFLVKERELIEKVDFRVEIVTSVKFPDHNFSFDCPTKVLFMNHTRVFQKYRKHGATTRDFVLPVKTLEYYLMTSKEYLGKKSSCPFLMKEGDSTEFNMSGRSSRQITTSHTFHYELIMKNYGINIVTEEIDENQENMENSQPNSQNVENNPLAKTNEKDLPF
ncbi:MAG: DNA primase [Bacteroidales bacterium]